MSANKLVRKYRFLLYTKRLVAVISFSLPTLFLIISISGSLMAYYLLPLMKKTLDIEQANKLFTAMLNQNYYGIPFGQTIPILGKNVPASNFEIIVLVLIVLLLSTLVTSVILLRLTEKAIAKGLGRDTILENYQNSIGQEVIITKLKSGSEWSNYFNQSTTTNFNFVFNPKQTVAPFAEVKLAENPLHRLEVDKHKNTEKEVTK